MSDEQGAQLVDVQLVVADWYRKRLGTFFRRTLNQGLGAYLIFAVSLTTATISARLAWVGGLEDRSYVSTLMKTEIQPQSEATRGVVLSLLIAGLNETPLSDELYCNGPKAGACNLGTKLWRVTQGLVDEVEGSAERGDNSPILADKIASVLESEPGDLTQVGLADRLDQIVAERKRLLASASLIGVELRDDLGDSCGVPEEISKRANTFYLAAPSCIGKVADLTMEVVPQQVADALDIPQQKGEEQKKGESEQIASDQTSAAQSTGKEPSECVMCCREVADCESKTASRIDTISKTPRTEVRRLRDFRVLRAQLDSELFDIAVGSMQEKLASTESQEVDLPTDESDQRKPTGPSIAAAFFISVDSVIRYWARPGEVKPGGLPSHRVWAARPYFETMLNTMDASSPLITRAYMDFAGHGIVYTECEPLTGSPRQFPPRTAPASIPSDLQDALPPSKEKVPRVVLGAVCVDYALSNKGVADLVTKVDSGPVADAVRVVFGKGAAGKWAPEPITRLKWADPKNLTTALESAAKDFSTDAASRRDIELLDVSGLDASVFLVPLRVRHDGKLDAIVLRVGGVGPLGSRPEAMIFTTVFGAIALGALLAGFRSSKAVASREQLLGRLRSLQVGVIQTDIEERITAANDRAEELLDRVLPPFGIEARVFPNFWEIFDPDAILLHDRDGLNTFIEERSLSDVELGSEESIKAYRREGKTTAYFARLKVNRTSCVATPDERTNNSSAQGDKLSPSWVRITAGPILRPLRKASAFRLRSKGADAVDLEANFGVVEPVSSRLGTSLDKILEKLTTTPAAPSGNNS